MPSSQPESYVYISDIALTVRPQFGKTSNCISFRNQTKSFKKKVLVTISPGDGHREVFEPALKLSVKDELLIKMWHPIWIVFTSTRIIVKLSEVDAVARDDYQGKRVYSTSNENVEVTISISSPSLPQVPEVSPSQSDVSHDILLPATGDILRICPRFRLLIIGNSGVGKSTLIQRVFGVKDVNVASDKRGKADINHEFFAEENKLFVLHDSLGLEAANTKNMDVIEDFINGRQQKPDLKDKLHAIWVCLPIPYAGGRLLEAGMEEFLKNRKRILGDIPVVIVLTKLDLVHGKFLLKGGDINEDRSKFLEEHCVEPLVRARAGDLPRVAVSTASGFGLESTIPELVKTTTSAIEQYVRSDKSYAEATRRSTLERDAQIHIAEMAQRGSLEAKVKLTITLGKKRYWKSIGASASAKFTGNKVKDYILGIHEEVIQIWNFYDPDKALLEEGFKVAVLDTSNLGVRNIQGRVINLNSLASVFAMFATQAGINMHDAKSPISYIGDLARICRDIYNSTQTMVKRFMAYIVDLVCVMTILFVLAPQGLITAHDVELALKVYKSAYRDGIHSEIQDYGTILAILPGGRDPVIYKIEELIGRFVSTDEEMVELRAQIRSAQHAAAQAQAPTT